MGNNFENLLIVSVICFKQKQSKICCFHVVKYKDLLLLFLIYDGK